MSRTWLKNYVEAFKSDVNVLPLAAVEQMIATLVRAWREDRQIFVAGNGGSAANASHFVTDLGKGASDKLPRRFRVMSLNDCVSWMTAIGNDYSYDDIFVRQLENYARPGDVLMVLSVSGNSPNIVKALEWATAHGLHTVAMVGGKRGKAGQLAKEAIVIDSAHYGRVEDCHMVVCHLACYAFMENPTLVA